jgi:hypothetical protein
MGHSNLPMTHVTHDPWVTARDSCDFVCSLRIQIYKTKQLFIFMTSELCQHSGVASCIQTLTDITLIKVAFRIRSQAHMTLCNSVQWWLINLEVNT